MREHQRYCSQLLVLLAVLCIMSCYVGTISGKNGNGIIEVDVGVILDADDIVGKVSQTCMSMALEDFYAINQNQSTTRIVLHQRDSKGDVVEAASAAIDLLKNVQVQAILGPLKSSQAEFVIDIGNKTQVPIISQAMSPFLSSADNPYFIRGAQSGSSQVASLTAIVQAFGWREVVLIYEDTDYGRGAVPYLTASFQGISTQVRHRSVISLSASDDHILQELYKLKTMQTRVFVVHMLPFLASRFFANVKKVEMMNEGYAWIITDGLTSLLDYMDPTIIISMQGVIGVKPYVPQSSQLENFEVRWRKRFRQENQDVDITEVNVLGLWAYDSVTALAMAVGRSGVGVSKFEKPVEENLTDLAAIGISETGPRLLQSLQNIEFNGLSGKFHILNGQLRQSSFQIINVIGKGDREIGFWTRKYGISRNLSFPSSKNYSTNKDDLGAIIWPGGSIVVPKGWEMPIGEAKLRVGVPVKTDFSEFVSVNRNPQTNDVDITGFCIDVFKEVMDHYIPYTVPYEFFPFETPDGEFAGSYDDLVYQIFLGNYDVVAGDVTIVSNRSRFVDFTLPYTESGVGMIVPLENDDRKNAWIFIKPLNMDLWLTTGAFFIFTGFVVWVIERRVNQEFRGSLGKQVGMIFWFSFSTLVFSQQEKLISHLSRFVLTVWVFVVLVLTSSYTASLTSMLTVEKLKPSITDIKDLIQSKEYVGYPNGSFVEGLLKSKPFDTSKLKNIEQTAELYDEALSIGSKNGGVAAIVDELPYIRSFLSNPNYCAKYTMVGPIYMTAGFGFAFPRGSPLVPDVSRAILKLAEQDVMTRIEEKWLGKGASCAEQGGARITSGGLTLDSFKGLFIVAAVTSLLALKLFLLILLCKNRNTLAANDLSIREKFIAMAKSFHEEKENSSDASRRKHPTSEGIVVPAAATPDHCLICPQSPSTCDSLLAEQIVLHDEGPSTTETSTPLHETIETVENNEE